MASWELRLARIAIYLLTLLPYFQILNVPSDDEGEGSKFQISKKTMVKSSIWNNQRLAPFYLSSSQQYQHNVQTLFIASCHLHFYKARSSRDQRLHLHPTGSAWSHPALPTHCFSRINFWPSARAHGLARVWCSTVPDVFFACDLNGIFGTRILYVCNVGVGCCYEPFRCWEGSPARAMMMGSYYMMGGFSCGDTVLEYTRWVVSASFLLLTEHVLCRV